jgi:hypothetical protein
MAEGQFMIINGEITSFHEAQICITKSGELDPMQFEKKTKEVQFSDPKFYVNPTILLVS